jgi:hypothetical protein
MRLSISQMHLNDDGALSALAYGVGILGVRHGNYFLQSVRGPNLTYARVVLLRSYCCRP